MAIGKAAESSAPRSCQRPPQRATARSRGPTENRKQQSEDDTEEQDCVVEVVHYVMTHLMPHGGHDGLRGTAVQQIVVQGDALGTEKPADIGADAVALARCIYLIYIGRGYTVGPCQAQNLILNPRVLKRCVGVE